MKLLQLFTSRRGAVSGMKLAGVALAAGMVGMNIYGYLSGPTTVNSPEVRSLSQIMNARQPLPPEYAGIANSFSVGNLQFATAEEKAAREGYVFDGGDEAVANMENFTGQVFSGGEAGLGMGGNKVNMVDGGASGNVSADVQANGAAIANAARRGQSGAAASATQEGAEGEKTELQKTKINRLGDSSGSNFQRAAMAHASGSALNSSGFGAPTAEKTTPVSPSVSSRSDLLKSAMAPGSTHVVGASRFKDPSYKPSQAEIRARRLQDGRVNGGLDDLQYVAKVSANVARKSSRSDNEVITRSFLSSRGTTVTYDDANIETKSTLGDVPEDTNIDNKLKKLDDHITAVSEYETSKTNATNHLKNIAMALALTTIMMMPLIRMAKNIQPPWVGWAVAGAMVLTIVGMGIALGVKAGQYSQLYGADKDSGAFAGALISAILCPIMAGLCLFPGGDKGFGHVIGNAIDKVIGWVGKGSMIAMGGFSQAFMSLFSDPSQALKKISPFQYFSEMHEAGTDGSFDSDKVNQLKEKAGKNK